MIAATFFFTIHSTLKGWELIFQNVIIGAAIHAPIPTVGGFLKNPDPSKFPDLIKRLEGDSPAGLRGIETFAKWNETLVRNTDYLYLRNDKQYDFLEGDIVNSNGKRMRSDKFLEFMEKVVIPYSQSEGYKFSDTHEDYLVGSLARMNFNKDLLNPELKLMPQIIYHFSRRKIFTTTILLRQLKFCTALTMQ